MILLLLLVCIFVYRNIFIYDKLRIGDNKCNKMSSISCVTETCARDPTPQGKRLEVDYGH